MRVNEVAATALKANSVDVMFGVMGDANMFIADSFHRAPGGRFIAAANEGGAVLMAAGYAAVSGMVGVATVTHGAILNCVTALFEAERGRYPVLVVAGDTARVDEFHLQNVPQHEVVRPTGAEYRVVRSADSIATDITTAILRARARRGPVVLEVPADIQLAETDSIIAAPGEILYGRSEPSRDSLEEMAAVLSVASRPVILAGRGVDVREALPIVRALAERLGAPVATTLRGKGLFRDDAFDLGICGTLSSPVASEVIAASDCLVAMGAGLSPLTTLKGDLMRGKKVIQIDSDPRAIGRFLPVDVGVVADAQATARALIKILDEAEIPPAAARSQALADRLATWHAEDRAPRSPQKSLDITGVLQRIDDLVSSTRSLTIDGGRFSHEALRTVRVQEPSHYAHCLNVGHIGLSVSVGIGAAVGRADPSLVIVGDGSFMLGGLAELNTAVRYGLDIIVVLLNDGAYGAEYYRFVAQGLDPALTTFEWPSFASVASALGARGIQVREWDDFALVEQAITERGPLLIEVVLDRDAIPDPGEH